MISIRSVHSARMMRTNRSARAFIRGVCGAVSTPSMLMAANTVSKAAVNFASRSRIRYLNRCPCSRSGAKSRASCVAQMPMGWRATSSRWTRRVRCSMTNLRPGASTRPHSRRAGSRSPGAIRLGPVGRRATCRRGSRLERRGGPRGSCGWCRRRSYVRVGTAHPGYGQHPGTVLHGEPDDQGDKFVGQRRTLRRPGDCVTS